MTPLRERYVQDLRLRNKSPRTIETYVLRVALFARHLGCSPEKLGPEDLRRYQEHLIARNVSWSTFNQAVCALRFLYQVTLGRPEAIRHLPFAKRPRIVPTVLSPEEVVRFLEAAVPGRDRMLLDVIYSCGLRLEEALGLRLVRQAKNVKRLATNVHTHALAAPSLVGDSSMWGAGSSGSIWASSS